MKRFTVTRGSETHHIEPEELNQEELQLLQSILDRQQPAQDFPLPNDPLALALHRLLVLEEEVPETAWSEKLSFPLRVIHFRFPKQIDEQEAFSQAASSLFPGSRFMLWKSHRDSMILQETDEAFEDELNLSSVVDTLAADFFVRPSVCVGSMILSPQGLKEHIDWEHQLFHDTAAAFPKKHTFLEQELLLYFMLSRFTPQTITQIRRQLKPVEDESELLESVRCFLECNLNISLAAKKMFMHRNSMQYRVDKFIEKTTLDIRQFQNAAAVYLMLLTMPSSCSRS
ncbi:PucR family transcriptional regulator [Alkalicoccus luteus]|uniref:PucR family transcriptional regulator n=1 Tax=Alkalicoccus luteus TaxID=1237094 RepID=UPI0040332AE6